MDTGIGTSRAMRGYMLPGKALEHTFYLALHSASDGLTLPSLEAAPVELEQCEEGPVHLPESSRFTDPEQAAQLLVRIDKTSISQLRFRPDSRTPDTPDVTVLADHQLRLALRKLAHGEPLARSESAAAFSVLFGGGGTAAQVGALLMGLRARGETADDLAGAADALRHEMRRVDVREPERLVDTCGTGGGQVTTLNLSTAAAFVAAGAGVPIAKHGNRSYTSRSGSADVLEALGVNIDLDPDRAAGVLEEAGIIFLFAPAFHPAMRFLTPARRELATPTIMNLLGPLANPAGAGRQVVGVADRDRAPLLAGALRALGSRRAMVVHAEAGMDELSPSGVTHVWNVMNGAVTESVIDPAQLQLEVRDLDGLAGGDPQDNARRMVAVLEGRGSDVETAAIILNAAAAIAVSSDDGTMEAGVKRAREALTSGAARAVLGRLRKAGGSRGRGVEGSS
jgi:anthranilate phosphoribosyltransferase